MSYASPSGRQVIAIGGSLMARAVQMNTVMRSLEQKYPQMVSINLLEADEQVISLASHLAQSGSDLMLLWPVANVLKPLSGPAAVLQPFITSLVQLRCKSHGQTLFALRFHPELQPFTPEDLLAWRERLDLSDEAACRLIGLPIKTWREYLPGGRRRQDCLPGWLWHLTRYVEKDLRSSMPFNEN